MDQRQLKKKNQQHTYIYTTLIIIIIWLPRIPRIEDTDGRARTLRVFRTTLFARREQSAEIEKYWQLHHNDVDALVCVSVRRRRVRVNNSDLGENSGKTYFFPPGNGPESRSIFLLHLARSRPRNVRNLIQPLGGGFEKRIVNKSRSQRGDGHRWGLNEGPDKVFKLFAKKSDIIFYRAATF